MGGSGNTRKPAISDIVIFNLLLPKLLTAKVSPTANPQSPANSLHARAPKIYWPLLLRRRVTLF